MKYLLVIPFTVLVCSFCSKSTYQPNNQRNIVETPDVIIKSNTEVELQSLLKTVGATTDHLKKYVVVDIGCPIEKIVIKEKFE